MGDSYRIKTELGINKSINIQLDQEFEFLEILSLKIQQTLIKMKTVLGIIFYHTLNLIPNMHQQERFHQEPMY